VAAIRRGIGEGSTRAAWMSNAAHDAAAQSGATTCPRGASGGDDMDCDWLGGWRWGAKALGIGRRGGAG